MATAIVDKTTSELTGRYHMNLQVGEIHEGKHLAIAVFDLGCGLTGTGQFELSVLDGTRRPVLFYKETMVPDSVLLLFAT